LICTIDIGNTKKNFAIWENEKIIDHGVWETEPNKKMLSCSNWVISNVTGKEITYPSDVELMHVSSKAKLPFKLNYKTPNTLGSDRLASVSGAIMSGFDSAIIIDCGTCIKIEVLAKKVYLGGSISPGVFMRFKALETFTGKLPLIEPAEFKSNFGTSTQDSILCGVIQGASAELEERINRIKEEIEPCPVLITGGDANLLQNHIKEEIFAHPNLLHSGLFKLYSINV